MSLSQTNQTVMYRTCDHKIEVRCDDKNKLKPVQTTLQIPLHNAILMFIF